MGAASVTLAAALPAAEAYGPHGVRAAQIAEHLQDMHLPVSRHLCAALAEMEAATIPADILPWGLAWARIGDVLGLGKSTGRSRAWAPMTPAFIQHVAEPVLRAVGAGLGNVALSFLPGPGAPGPDGAFDNEKLDAWVRAAMEDQERMGRAFWADAAVSLMGALDRATMSVAARRDQEPFEVAALLARLVYCCEPELPEDADQRRKRRPPRIRAQVERSGQRPREGGVTGLTHSRRVEEMHEAIASTFAAPRELLALKFLEEGFHLPDRPPPRRPSRDLLAGVICRAEPGGASAAVAKAAWIDATLRLQVLLNGLGFAKSDLGWCDIGPRGLRASALCVEPAEGRARAVAGLPAHLIGGDVRRMQISRSSLMPEAFDISPRHARHPKDGPMPDSAAHTATLAAIASARSRAEAGRLGAQRAGAKGAGNAKTEDYARRLVIEVSSGVSPGGGLILPDWGEVRARLLHGVRPAQGARAALILLPHLPAENEAFRIFDDTSPDGREIAPDSDTSEAEAEAEAEALAQLIGALSMAIVNMHLGALDAG